MQPPAEFHAGRRAKGGLRRSAGMALAICLLAALARLPERQQPRAGDPNGMFGQTTQHGYVVSPDALEQIPPGSSRDQVLIALGSPSTTANYGSDVFYYISQTRYRGAAFMPDKVVDQRIVAVYFDNKDQVDHVANYGIKDGKVFDFITRTTPTGGADQTFLQQVLSGVVGFGSKGI